MPVLRDYVQFEGRHWETGSVANVLAYQRPAAKQPLSEPMLLGLSGGATFGYFVFDYQDTDPHVALLSRNTFDPLETLFDRLAIPQDLLQTASPEKAMDNLLEVLESGRPAIVWADAFSLPYNALAPDEGMWAMEPIVVYGVEGGMVHIADRSQQPLTVTVEELAAARARIKKDRFRVLGLGEPNLSRLPQRIEEAIGQCVSLFLDAPPKGARDNFGLAAYTKLASMLTNTRNKQSWQRLLPPGRRMYAALAGAGYQPGAFGWARTFSANQVKDRAQYADFLDEAAEILGQPGLQSAADRFRESSAAWREFSEAMLPAEVPLFKETRELLIEKRDLFVERGGAALAETEAINSRLTELRELALSEFPLTEEQATQLRGDLAEHVKRIRGMEESAVMALQEAIS